MNLAGLTIHEAHELLKSKQVSSRELTESVLARVEAVDGKVKSYVTVTADIALKSADEADKKIASGEEIGPLTGIPVAIKDNMCTRGILTTCSSKILYNYKPVYDATVVEKLAAAGAVMVGKTNLDEFAMGSSTENSGFFASRNPWNTDMAPGGSSGGSAAAVAADECLGALGSDTGG
ncbi:MAG: amidase, partial [Armatimonadota bacterium]|nr:amidase [Armatimonadota bacterium]